MIQHHPADDLLLDYARGTLAPAPSLLLASHLALCPACRAQMQMLTAVGGALLDALEPSAVQCTAHDILARADRAPTARPVAAAAPPHSGAAILPAPLRALLGGDVDQLDWKRVAPGFEEIILPLAAAPGARSKLIRVRAGSQMPHHRHSGTEMTLVLQGGFRDRFGSYARGDLASLDGDQPHAPLVDADGPCISMLVSEGPLRFTGLFSRLMSLFIRF